MSVDLATLGETMYCVVPTDSGDLTRARSAVLGCAGGESNVAMGLARLGHRTAWVSRVGDDPLGRRVRSEVAQAGVDISGVETDPDGYTGVMFKEPDTGTVHYLRRGSAASRMDERDVARLGAFAPGAVHVTGVTAALSPSCWAVVTSVLDGAVPGSPPTGFDVNFRPALWAGRDAGALLLDLAKRADVVFVGRDEAETLWGCESADDVRRLLPGPATLVVKDAGAPAVCFGADGRWRSAPEPCEVVEPTGAGDAFAAGWWAASLRGLPPTERLEYGHRMAAAVLRGPDDVAAAPPPGVPVLGDDAASVDPEGVEASREWP